MARRGTARNKAGQGSARHGKARPGVARHGLAGHGKVNRRGSTRPPPNNSKGKNMRHKTTTNTRNEDSIEYILDWFYGGYDDWKLAKIDPPLQEQDEKALRALYKIYKKHGVQRPTPDNPLPIIRLEDDADPAKQQRKDGMNEKEKR